MLVRKREEVEEVPLPGAALSFPAEVAWSGNPTDQPTPTVQTNRKDSPSMLAQFADRLTEIRARVHRMRDYL